MYIDDVWTILAQSCADVVCFALAFLCFETCEGDFNRFFLSLLCNKSCKIDEPYRFGKLGVSAFVSAFQKSRTIDIYLGVVF